MIYRKRDLVIIEVDDKSLVIACDSCGGIGNKEGDVLKVDPFYVGMHTARVGIMEVMAVNAKVISVSDGVCNEMDSTGKNIIDGIKSELEKIDFDINGLTGSTEENFATSMTGVGITTIGVVSSSKLRFANIKSSDKVLLLGTPMFGEEVLNHGDKMMTYDDISLLLKQKNVLEIIPCGSKGIRYECDELANHSNTTFINSSSIDLNKSCGPASCAVVVVNENFEISKINIKTSLNIIGEFKSKT